MSGDGAAEKGSELADYKATLACEGVEEAYNPVLDFHNNNPLAEEGQRAICNIMLLGGAWRGIAHLKGQLRPDAQLEGAMQELVRVRDMLLPAGGEGCRFASMASESEFQVFPVIIRKPDGFDEQEPLDAAVAALGINSAISGGTSPVKSFATSEEFLKHLENKTLHLDEYPEDEDGLKILQAARQLFQGSGLTQGRYMEVVAGDEEDEHNPVLVFWLGAQKEAPFLLGLMSAIIWT